MPHSRRAFLASGAALGTVPLLGCGPQLRDLRLSSLPAALDEMRRLGAAPALQSQTAWGWAQTLEHLAQSVEYSMTGYPTQQSVLFQRLAGRPAFQLFAWRGQMRHDLTAPIPGSPALAAGTPLAAASLRLLTACGQFLQWRGPLQPHFAYGALTHAEYEQAHAMHLANHFAAFQIPAE